MLSKHAPSAERICIPKEAEKKWSEKISVYRWKEGHARPENRSSPSILMTARTEPIALFSPPPLPQAVSSSGLPIPSHLCLCPPGKCPESASTQAKVPPPPGSLPGPPTFPSSNFPTSSPPRRLPNQLIIVHLHAPHGTKAGAQACSGSHMNKRMELPRPAPKM